MEYVATPAYLSTASSTFEAEFKARLHWSAEADAAIEQRVADILADVQARGDAAVLAYTARFDGLTVASTDQLELTQAELKAAFDAIPSDQREALQARIPKGLPAVLPEPHAAWVNALEQEWLRRYGTH